MRHDAAVVASASLSAHRHLHDGEGYRLCVQLVACWNMLATSNGQNSSGSDSGSLTVRTMMETCYCPFCFYLVDSSIAIVRLVGTVFSSCLEHSDWHHVAEEKRGTVFELLVVGSTTLSAIVLPVWEAASGLCAVGHMEQTLSHLYVVERASALVYPSYQMEQAAAA